MRRAAPGVVVLAFVSAAMLFFVITDSFADTEIGLDAWAYVIVGGGSLAFGGVGLVISTRAPRLPIGWLFLITAIVGGLGLLLYAPDRLPDIGNAIGFCMVIAAVAALASFPDGRFEGRRWKWAIGVLIASALAMVTGGVAGSGSPLNELPVQLAFFSTIVVGAAALIRLALMYSKGPASVRQQLKWLVLVLVVGSILLAMSTWGGFASLNLNNVAGVLMTVGAPVAIGLAVLRYRLYEIDRIISRTLGYAMVVGVLGLVYGLGAVWLPTRLVGDQVPAVFVAGSTLLVIVLFNPVRRRLLGWVDRRFYRSRYDAVRVAEEFGGRVKDRVDVDGLAVDWMGVVSETMRPRTVGVWVRR